MGLSSFVLNNVAYINVIENCSDQAPVYTFDPLANTWTPSGTIFLPDTADLRLGFAVNGKGYLGYGRLYMANCGINGGHSQLYEYSPEATAVDAQADPGTGVTVFPNPAGNRITLRLHLPAEENMLVILTDVTGKEAGRWTMEKGDSELGRNTLSVRTSRKASSGSMHRHLQAECISCALPTESCPRKSLWKNKACLLRLHFT